MWLMTNFGFFSVVEKPGDKQDGVLTVRARVRDDLIALRNRYLPELGEIEANAGTDYKYRARISRNALANAAARIVGDIDYQNFKSSVGKEQGSERAHVYADVWTALHELQETAAQPIMAGDDATGSRRSYGGVLIDDEGRVLLREPANHFDGYAWTFPKGRADAGEPQVEVALREVREEAGYRAEVLSRIPGVFTGSTGENVYFLMRPVGDPAPFSESETQAIRWATPEEARRLISQTTNAVGRQRDLAVLEAALAVLAGRGNAGVDLA
jgi:8-oxo-dGTP pyrophosphatase MutT (NUDIX family)